MTKKRLNPGMKILLEYGPILAFFVGYIVTRDMEFTVGAQEYSGFIAVTAVFIPLLALTTFIQWRMTGHLSRMQIMTLILVTVFGGMSIWFNDERFFKMKPTMIYLLFAIMLGIGLMRGESYLAAVMDEALPLKKEGWMILTKRVTALFLALAVINEIVWRTMSTDSWVTFKTFGLTIGIFVFFMSQSSLFVKYALTADEAEAREAAKRAAVDEAADGA